MPQAKDGAERILEDYDKVFLDIMNNLVFHGRQVIREGELENVIAASQMKLEDGELHQQTRDTVKLWKQGRIILASCGMENQTWSTPCMPMQAFSYDGATYKTQVNRYYDEKRNKLELTPFYPSITIVLYFGEKHWSGPRTLRACFPNLREELIPFVPDYPLHIIEVAFLTEEEVGRLQSDFVFVAEYLTQVRTKKAFVPSRRKIDYLDATLNLMQAITGDNRFEKAMRRFADTGKEPVTMYNVFDEYFQQGCEETRKQYEVVLAEKDRSLAEKDRSLAEKDHSLAEKDRSLAEKDRSLAEKDRNLVEKDRSLAEKDHSLAEKDRSLAEKDRSLAEKDMKIADLMARIRELESSRKAV